VSFQAQVLRVLIASPGDVAEERKALPQAIHDWNGLNAHALGVVVLPVLWEAHSLPEMGDRPQAIINRQLADEADILVAAFWTRLGSPTGEAASGTVEEISRFRAADKPVLIYFSSAPVHPDSIDTVQFDQLKAFREQCRAEGLVGHYDTVDELRRQVGNALTRLIRDTAISEPTDAATRIQQVPTLDDALDSYRKQLQIAVARSQARWGSMADDFAPDDWQWHMQSLCEELAEYEAQLTVFLGQSDAALVEDLRLLGIQARQLSRQQFYIDGGRSLEVFKATATHLYTNLSTLLKESWSSYVARRISATQEQPSAE
jgi:hypothetical protein